MKKSVLLSSVTTFCLLCASYLSPAQAIVNGGTYKISRIASVLAANGDRLCLEVPFNSSTAGAAITQFNDNGNDAQRFIFELQAGTTNEYKLRHKGTSLYIQTVGRSKAVFALLEQNVLLTTNDDAQRWVITSDVNGYEFALKNSGGTVDNGGLPVERQVIDVANATSGQQLNIFNDYNTAVNQRWALTLIMPAAIKNASEAVLKTQAYPNPATNGQDLTLKVETISSGSADVDVLDMLGRSVHRQRTALKAGANSVALHNQPLAAGVYVVRVSQGEFIQQTRVVQQ